MLTVSLYQQLKALSKISFTFKNKVYQCNLTDLPIKEAGEWLKLKKNRRHKNYQLIERWLQLALSYYDTVTIFHPKDLKLNRTVSSHLEVIGINDDPETQIVNTIHYWDNFKPDSIQDYVDLYRASLCLSLNPSDDIVIGRLLDLESSYGSLSTVNRESFYFLLESLQEVNNWESLRLAPAYSVIQKGLTVFTLWQDLHQLTEHNLQELLQKLRITIPLDFLLNPPIDSFTEDSTWDYDPTIPSDYKVLGITPDSTFLKGRARYRELLKQYHPDINPEGSTKTMELIKSWNSIKHTLRQ